MRDVAVYAFVLFLLPDAQAAVTEALRVLRPGGWLLAATWGTQLDMAADLVVLEEIDAAGAQAPGSPPVGRAHRHSPIGCGPCSRGRDSPTSAPPRVRWMPGSTPRPVLAMRIGSGSLGWRYLQLPRESQARVRERAAARLATLEPEEGFFDRSQVRAHHHPGPDPVPGRWPFWRPRPTSGSVVAAA